ncbi:C16orf89 [Bugula neritina]|uniref:C16orf89 n=1 Tax=Bugula neritina TaxID=10212 RepID=A0A7J7K0N3_BUGNE|nr:C16orf89 [Bugula neritina]
MCTLRYHTKEKIMRIGLCFLYLALISSNLAGFPTSNDISDILHALEKIVSFYTSSAGESNLDGLYGLKVVEGVLKELINNSFLFSLLQDDLKQRLQLLLLSCRQPLLVGIKAVEKNDPAQYKNLKALITEDYTANNIPRNIKKELKWPFVLNLKDSFEAFDEATSDGCIGDVIRSRGASECALSKSCAKAATTQNLQSYPLTHQLLFSIEAEKLPQCAAKWDEMLIDMGYYSNVEFQRIWCTNSYYEVQGLVKVRENEDGVKHYSVDTAHLDIFFEHLYVCPSIGFYELLKEEYLPIIYRAQDDSGCYRLKTSAELSPAARKPLVEAEAKDGCMFHLTAVAATALSSYLRYSLHLKYAPDKLNTDLINDHKHYLEAVEVLKLKPRSRISYSIYKNHYIIFVVVNVIFFILFFYRKKLFICRTSRKYTCWW